MADERAPSAIDKKLGERVRARRLEIGMSQEQLADTLGITFQQVQKYEAGTTRLSAGRLYEVARLLNCDVRAFFDPIENEEVDLEPIVENTGKNVSELLQSYSKLEEPEIQLALLNLLRCLNDQRLDTSPR